MIFFILLFFLFLPFCTCIAQEEFKNIVPNPGFEKVKSAPIGWYYKGKDFDRNVRFWNSPTSASPDYYCEKCTVPQNWKDKGFGVQKPHNGFGMAGLTLYGCLDGKPHCREYVQVEMIEKLVIGQNYYIEFWVNHIKRSLRIDNIGALFLENPINLPGDDLIRAKPYINSNNIISSKNGEWLKMSGNFTAIDTSQYLIIGNFFPDSLTSWKSLSSDSHNYAYYYIDDVVVKKIDPILPVEHLPGDLHEIKLEKGKSFVLQQVYFESDKSDLLPRSFYELNTLIEIMNNNPKMKIQIEGHTDSQGEEIYNQKLSEQRATAIMNYLIEEGVNRNRLKAIGLGEKFPIADNMYEPGRKINRRVAFKIVEL